MEENMMHEIGMIEKRHKMQCFLYTLLPTAGQPLYL